MNYSQKLLDPRWQKKRLKIMERDNFTCTVCKNDKQTLHIHHKSYKGDPWDAPDHFLTTLCESCHYKEHNIDPYKPMHQQKIKKSKPKYVDQIDFLHKNSKIKQGARDAYFKLAKSTYGSDRAYLLECSKELNYYCYQENIMVTLVGILHGIHPSKFNPK